MNRIRLDRTMMLLAAMTLLMCVGPTRAGDDKNVGRNVGQIAPDIVGKDVHDKDLKLSDFRGKVVVLDFFGDW